MHRQQDGPPSERGETPNVADGHADGGLSVGAASEELAADLDSGEHVSRLPFVPTTPGDFRVVGWERRTSAFYFIISLVFLAAFSWLILDPAMDRGLQALLAAVVGVIWLFYVFDYVLRFSLISRKRAFVARNIMDLIALVMPFARPFMLMRYLGRFTIFRHPTASRLRTILIAYLVIYAVLFVYVIALAVLAVERDAPGANITNFGDSVWWAIVTIGTVGYGDVYPVTAWGRVLATLLILAGLVLVAVATGTAVSFVNERIRHLGDQRSRDVDLLHSARERRATESGRDHGSVAESSPPPTPPGTAD